MIRSRRGRARGGRITSRPVVMQGGVFVFPSDGETIGFLVAHGGVKAPSEVRVEPRSANGVGERIVTVDREAIMVVYTAAPAGPYLHLYLEWGIHLERHAEHELGPDDPHPPEEG